MKKFLPVLLSCLLMNFVSAQEIENENCGLKKFVASESEDKQFPYDNFFFQRAYPDFGNILPALENAKRIAREEMNNNSRALNFNLPWQIEGPTNIGGRINVAAIDPTDTNVIYAGTSNGGIYKTMNGGANWFSVVDTLSYFAVGAATWAGGTGYR